jgi:hypothetical protein
MWLPGDHVVEGVPLQPAEDIAEYEVLVRLLQLGIGQPSCQQPGNNTVLTRVLTL